MLRRRFIKVAAAVVAAPLVAKEVLAEAKKQKTLWSGTMQDKSENTLYAVEFGKKTDEIMYDRYGRMVTFDWIRLG